MRIINPLIKKDIKLGNAIKLDLGGGNLCRDGFYCVDCLQLEGVDIVADLNEPLDLIPDNSVEYVYSNHVLEHVGDIILVLSEIYRITRPDGIIEIVVPHFSNPYGYSDPTHVRFFGLYSMYYFVDSGSHPPTRTVPTFYSNVRFRLNSIKIEFYKRSRLDKIAAPRIERWVNKSIHRQEFYERRLCGIFHAMQLRFQMQPDK